MTVTQSYKSENSGPNLVQFKPLFVHALKITEEQCYPKIATDHHHHVIFFLL